jgi:putative flippase GtrA
VADARDTLALISRFGLAGLLTTVVGFAVIAALDVGLGLPPPLANAGGYLVGIPLGFALNRQFVFRHGGAVTRAGLKYVGAILLALALNQFALHLVGGVLGESPAERLAAQLAGMGTYTVSNFVLFRLWVFRGSTAS